MYRFFFGYYGFGWLLAVRYYYLPNGSSARPPQIRTCSFRLMPAAFTHMYSEWLSGFNFACSLTHIHRPYMRFLSVRPDLCRQLPSDSTSRWTPLPLAICFPSLGRIRDFHPLEHAHAGRTRKQTRPIKSVSVLFTLSLTVYIWKRRLTKSQYDIKH